MSSLECGANVADVSMIFKHNVLFRTECLSCSWQIFGIGAFIYAACMVLKQMPVNEIPSQMCAFCDAMCRAWEETSWKEASTPKKTIDLTNILQLQLKKRKKKKW